MGIDMGFDLFPPLQDTDSDNKDWADFLSHVIAHYEKEKDGNMTINADGDVVFTQSEHPTLLRKGYRFRRFSSKISGRLAGDVEKYLEEVRGFAEDHFGCRVKWWSELSDTWFDDQRYTWTEVYEARKGNMDSPRKPEQLMSIVKNILVEVFLDIFNGIPTAGAEMSKTAERSFPGEYKDKEGDMVEDR
ncbi:hypothetical protein GYMLUDRAFT_85231 [Collybiopsis luxurians FD-317 M1]|uniref:Uncharacterized protein n=1 Tax=Collybiopsis luxurians FD-317 M1 TaxID=944289 RepID=A0A0D0CE67_9AGAR|nr:hypothetical protein GYMLUDRAFT_85231 [Collybiopsis luxurians FD-317 M1]